SPRSTKQFSTTRQKVSPAIPDHPIFCGTMVVQGDRAECRVYGEHVQIEAPGKLLARLAALCDGEHDREEIILELSSEWRRRNVLDLMRSCAEAGVLQEASDQTVSLWRLVSNPVLYGESPSNDAIATWVRVARGQLNGTNGLEYRSIPDFPLRQALQKRKS